MQCYNITEGVEYPTVKLSVVEYSTVTF